MRILLLTSSGKKFQPPPSLKPLPVARSWGHAQEVRNGVSAAVPVILLFCLPPSKGLLHPMGHHVPQSCFLCHVQNGASFPQRHAYPVPTPLSPFPSSRGALDCFAVPMLGPHTLVSPAFRPLGRCHAGHSKIVTSSMDLAHP